MKHRTDCTRLTGETTADGCLCAELAYLKTATADERAAYEKATAWTTTQQRLIDVSATAWRQRA